LGGGVGEKTAAFAILLVAGTMIKPQTTTAFVSFGEQRWDTK
jgi:hypothetical protein